MTGNKKLKVDYRELFDLFINPKNEIVNGKPYCKHNDLILNLTDENNTNLIFVNEISGVYQIVNRDRVKIKDSKILDEIDNSFSVKKVKNKSGDYDYTVESCRHTLNDHIRDIKSRLEYYYSNTTTEERTGEKENKFWDEIEFIRKELEERNCFHFPFYDLYKQERKKRIKESTVNRKAPEKIPPLHEKINWEKDPEILKEHLEILRAEGYIKYNEKDIDDIMSGNKKAEFKNAIEITGIFLFWDRKEFIRNFKYVTYGNDIEKRDYKNFILPNFLYKGKEPIKSGFSNLSRKRDLPKAEKLSEVIENLLTT